MYKYLSFIMLITVFLLLLLAFNKITLGLFFVILVPLGIAMLIKGIIEIKKIIKQYTN